MVLSHLLRSASLEECPELLIQREGTEARDGSKSKQAALVLTAVTMAVGRRENSRGIAERQKGWAAETERHSGMVESEK